MTIKDLLKNNLETAFGTEFNSYEFFNSQYNKKYVLLRHKDISNIKKVGRYVSWVWDNPITRYYAEKAFLENKLK